MSEMSDMSLAVTTEATVAEVDVRRHGVESTICKIYHFGVAGVLQGILVLVGLAGNLITMKVMWKYRNTTATYLCLFWLALADFLVVGQLGVLTIPSAFFKLMGNSIMYGKLNVYNNVYLSFSTSSSLLISTWLTVMVTWQRYVSVCLPYKVKEYCNLGIAKKQVAFIILASICFALPRVFETTPVLHHPGSSMLKSKFTPFAKTWSYSVFYAMILNYAVSFGLPIIGLSVMTVSLLWSLKQNRARKDGMVTGVKGNFDLHISLIIVIMVFLITRMFKPIGVILTFVFQGQRHCGQILFYYEVWAQTMSILNSAVNVIIYIGFAPRFKKKVGALLRFKCTNQIDPATTKWPIPMHAATASSGLGHQLQVLSSSGAADPQGAGNHGSALKSVHTTLQV